MTAIVAFVVVVVLLVDFLLEAVEGRGRRSKTRYDATGPEMAAFLRVLDRVKPERPRLLVFHQLSRCAELLRDLLRLVALEIVQIWLRDVENLVELSVVVDSADLPDLPAFVFEHKYLLQVFTIVFQFLVIFIVRIAGVSSHFMSPTLDLVQHLLQHVLSQVIRAEDHFRHHVPDEVNVMRGFFAQL